MIDRILILFAAYARACRRFSFDTGWPLFIVEGLTLMLGMIAAGAITLTFHLLLNQ